MYTKILNSEDHGTDEKLPFRTLSITHMSYDANWHSILHYHNFTEIFYCLEGEGYLQTDYGREKIKQNSLIVVNPYIEHTEHTLETKNLEYIVIGVEGPEVVFANHPNNHGLYHFHDYEREFYRIMQSIIIESNRAEHYSNTINDYYVNIMMLKLQNLTKSKLKQKLDVILSPSVTLAKNYIDSHFSRNITLEMLEKHSHISRFHLSHLFKKELGIAPINYLISVRLKNAAELLTSTGMTITQISQSSGFNSASYFTNKFKTIYGIAPSDYRIQNAESLKETSTK